ncbi:hypothetical protein [Alistipes sp. ZOR0009]|uniref:hypothetical protein n=1 Tax=Alistipes sp. ZOR0009 TaxID=1339253 RepID=UPI000645C347|nr:hypothetical protein [Alistipes sp. ZOR0009]
MRTIIPYDPLKLSSLGENILAKHAADNGSSDITMLVKEEVKESIANLREYAERADELRRLSEEMTERRNLEAKRVEVFVRSVRDVVNALHPNHPKKLTEYGFEVNEAPRKGK